MKWKWPRSQQLKTLVLSGFAASLLLAVNGCEGVSWNEASTRQEVQAKGPLRVGVWRHPLIYQESKRTHSLRGIDAELLHHFSEHSDLRLQFKVYNSQEQLLLAPVRKDIDLAAGRLFPSDSTRFLNGPPIQDSHISLFCQRRASVSHISDLKNHRLLILERDSQQKWFRRLQQWSSDLNIQFTSQSSARAFALIQAGKADCLLMDSLEGHWELQAWPSINHITDVTDSQSLTWWLQPERTDLQQLLQAWFQRASRDDEVVRIIEPYTSSLEQFEKSDIRLFYKKLREAFPRWEESFRQAAQVHDLPWKLVAAVAFQESHWEVDAESHTGVKGLMQLTEDTAIHLGVQNREDPVQSIWGGTAYLRELFVLTPASANVKDRWAMALASYNSGYGNLLNAQKLAIEQGLDPHSWRDLKRVYPLLEDPAIAESLKIKTARGKETVEFVERVQAYLHLWEKLEKISF